jgi:putative aminopeptidase FrvX
MTALELILKKTTEYLKIPSVVGYETFFLDYLEKDFRRLNLKTQRYKGLLLIEGSNPTSNIVSVHIDRHGLVANGIGELEYAAYQVKADKYGVDSEIKKKMWEKIASRFNGENVYAYNPITGSKIGEGTIASGYLCPVRENFIFRVKNLESLKKNTPVSFSVSCVANLKSVVGQLDNVLSVGLTYGLYKFGFQGSLLLTTEEEIGKSWEHVLDYFNEDKIETQKLFVFDTSPFDSSDNIDLNAVILRKRDNNSAFDKSLTNLILKKCEKLKIPFLLKDEYILNHSKKGDNINLGSTELGRIILESKQKINGTTVQIPTFGYHSNKETANFHAIENVFKLLNSVLN